MHTTHPDHHTFPGIQQLQQTLSLSVPCCHGNRLFQTGSPLTNVACRSWCLHIKGGQDIFIAKIFPLFILFGLELFIGGCLQLGCQGRAIYRLGERESCYIVFRSGGLDLFPLDGRSPAVKAHQLQLDPSVWDYIIKQMSSQWFAYWGQESHPLCTLALWVEWVMLWVTGWAHPGRWCQTAERGPRCYRPRGLVMRRRVFVFTSRDLRERISSSFIYSAAFASCKTSDSSSSIHRAFHLNNLVPNVSHGCS